MGFLPTSVHQWLGVFLVVQHQLVCKNGNFYKMLLFISNFYQCKHPLTTWDIWSWKCHSLSKGVIFIWMNIFCTCKYVNPVPLAVKFFLYIIFFLQSNCFHYIMCWHSMCMSAVSFAKNKSAWFTELLHLDYDGEKSVYHCS
jgi:hypothetical protein